MREVRKLKPEELRAALEIAVRAYPVMGIDSEQKMEETHNRIAGAFNIAHRTWYGLFEDGKLLGNMVFYDFSLNFYGEDVRANGIGFVAVDMLHKKQHIAKDMLNWYLLHSRKKGYPLALLYSFRPDFYKKMGFGYTTGCHNYVTSPLALPASEIPPEMEYLGIDDKDAVLDYYRSFYHENHGMILKQERDIEMMLAAKDIHRVGYREAGKLTALLIFRLISNESTNHSTHMQLTLLFSTPSGLSAALGFLHCQADQVSEIAISTPYNDLYYCLEDIRHKDRRILQEPGYHHVYDAGMGIMSRCLDPIYLLERKPCMLDGMRIRFCLKDSFLPGGMTDFVMHWEKGKAQKAKGKKSDYTIEMDIADFSAWVMNSIRLDSLCRLGLAKVSDPSGLEMLERAFYYPRQPICLERF